MLRTSLALSVFIGFAPISVVLAQELPPEGPIDSIFTWTERQQSMTTAGGMEAFTAEDFLVVSAASPGSVLDGLAGRCLSAGDQSPTGAAYQARGACTFTDESGDQIFETFETKNGAGTAKLIGGTGKYKGITADYTFTTSYFGSPAAGVWQGIGRKTGTYKIAK